MQHLLRLYSVVLVHSDDPIMIILNSLSKCVNVLSLKQRCKFGNHDVIQLVAAMD